MPIKPGAKTIVRFSGDPGERWRRMAGAKGYEKLYAWASSVAQYMRPASAAEVEVWLNKNQKRPFFIWIHLYDPHAPYDPPTPFDKFKDPYDGEVAYADASLGKLFNYLRERGLTLTVVVMTAAGQQAQRGVDEVAGQRVEHHVESAAPGDLGELLLEAQGA